MAVPSKHISVHQHSSLLFQVTLVVKILATTALVAGCWLLDVPTLNAITGWQIDPVLLYRLFGALAAALLVGYVIALLEHRSGKSARMAPVAQIVTIGIVSNGVSGALLLWSGKGLLFASGLLFVAIALGLLLSWWVS